jgi:TonB family protein
MRRILASLILTPALIHAQASMHAAGLPLEARTDAMKMAMPAVAGAAAPATAVPTPMLRISTGVIAAKVVKSSEIVYSASELKSNDNRVVVSMTVNEAGVPQNPQVVSSLNPALNQRVLEAVKQYRFKPAQLDQQSVPERVNLTFVFER